MTSTDQDFTTYAGDDALPVFTIYDGDGATIDISTVTQIEWLASRDADTAAVIDKLKSTGGIVLVDGGTDGQFTPIILKTDTAALTGFYFHRAIITDESGDVSTVTLGRWKVGPKPMSTYSGDPQLSDRDAVRMYIGDTDSDSWQLTDPEIDYLLTTFGSPLFAAAQAARNIASKYARKVTKRVGDLSISYGDLQKNYLDLAAELEARASTMGIAPYSGGTSIADIIAVNQNTDRPKPSFRRDMFDNRSGIAGTSESGYNITDGDNLPDGS